LLSALLVSSLLVLSAGALVLPWRREPLASAAVWLPGVATQLLCLWLARRGRGQLAAHLYTWPSLMAVSLLVWMCDGAFYAFAAGYGVVVVAGTLVLGARLGAVVAAVALASIVGRAFAVEGGWAPVPWAESSPADAAASLIITTLTLYVLGTAAARTFAGALGQLVVQAKDTQAQRALLEAAETLGGSGSWEWNLVSGEVRWSPNLYRILRAQLTETPSSQLFISRVHPDDRARVTAQALRMTSENTLEVSEYRLQFPDGAVRLASTLGLVIEKGRRAVGVMTDITEQRATQQEKAVTELVLKRALDATRAAVWSFDAKTGQLTWSAALREFLGYGDDVPASLEAYYKRVHPQDVQGEKDRAAAHLAGHGPPPSPYRIVRPDGVTRWILSYVSQVAEATFVGVNIDITETRQLEDQLAQAKKVDLLGQLAGGIAHDFNNLLTVIRLATELLPEGEGAQEILSAADRATGLTRRLLALSRHSDTAPQAIDLVSLLSDLGPVLQRLLGERIRLKVELPPGPVPVWSTASDLESILVNLVVNARDAMEQGGDLVIRLRTQPGEEAGTEQVVLEVEDFGVGMTADTLARAFDPFFTTKRPGQGTGLGLAVVQRAVRSAGGTVRAQSVLGKGTVFSVTLPRHLGPVTAHLAEASPTAVSPRATRLRVLLVEDDPLVARSVSSMLAHLGADAEWRDNARTAIDLLREQPVQFNLIITDMVLGVGNGLDILRFVSEQRLAVPLILMSGYNPEEMPRDVTDVRWRFLAKPFSKHHLDTLMAGLLPGWTAR